MSILAVLEQRPSSEGRPEWNRMSWETLAAAQQFARELQQPVSAAVLGDGIAGLAADLASRRLDKAFAVEHPLLASYMPDAYPNWRPRLAEWRSVMSWRTAWRGETWCWYANFFRAKCTRISALLPRVRILLPSRRVPIAPTKSCPVLLG